MEVFKITTSIDICTSGKLVRTHPDRQVAEGLVVSSFSMVMYLSECIFQYDAVGARCATKSLVTNQKRVVGTSRRAPIAAFWKVIFAHVLL